MEKPAPNPVVARIAADVAQADVPAIETLTAHADQLSSDEEEQVFLWWCANAAPVEEARNG